jgi:hypothetical protein
MRVMRRLRMSKPFKLDGDEVGCVCHYNSVKGPLIIDICMTSFTLEDAKRFRKWLDGAIDEVEKDQKDRKLKLKNKGRGKELVIG